VQQQPEATKEEQKQQQHTLFSSFDALWNRPQMTVTEDTEAHSKDPLLEWCVLCKTKMTFTEHETDRLAGRWLNTYLTQMYARIGVCVPSFPVLEAIVIPPKVTDKLVTLALQSLYEHVQAFHRLQQRTERGHSNPFALLVPRLYFQIK
jgi:hypothetical protein